MRKNMDAHEESVSTESTTQEEATPIKKWGSDEHDTNVHSVLQPHVGRGEYDPKHHHYRTNGG